MYISKEITDDTVIKKILLIRGKKVMLDRDLAQMYGVPTKVLNQAVKRNLKRFPPDFMFQLSPEEFASWKNHSVITPTEKMGLRKRPNAFTEKGVAMLSSVLGSETAIEVNIQIIRIFSRIREVLLTHKDVLIKLEQLEVKILNQDRKVEKQQEEIRMIFEALKELLDAPKTPRRAIGYK